MELSKDLTGNGKSGSMSTATPLNENSSFSFMIASWEEPIMKLNAIKERQKRLEHNLAKVKEKIGVLEGGVLKDLKLDHEYLECVVQEVEDEVVRVELTNTILRSKLN